jgi:hypothetical protein
MRLVALLSGCPSRLGTVAGTIGSGLGGSEIADGVMVGLT